jgi:GPH family glycoside/pentoside/hexuronide:cation symporter
MNPSPAPEKRHHDTPAEDRVPGREKLGLGIGRMIVEGTHGSQYVLVNPVYNMQMGMSTALLSVIDFIKRIFDAMIDPILGQFSDNFRSRWGRRLPLMAVALVPLSILFGALWWFPAGASEMGLFWHLLLVSLVFYTFHTLYAIPLSGLMLESTNDYHERSRVVGVSLAFGFVIQIASQWLPKLTYTLGGINPETGLPDTVKGVRIVALGCMAIFVLVGLIPLFLCKEHQYKRIAGRQKKIPILASLRAVWNDRQFMTVLWSRFIFCFCYSLVGIMGGYMNVYYVFHGDKQSAFTVLGYIGSSYHVCALLASLFLFPRLVRKIGKKTALQTAAIMLVVGCICKLFLYDLSTPEFPWWQAIVLGINGVANAGFTLIPTAMIADLADEDEVATGNRREAVFGALLSWFEKAGNSVGGLISGFMLVWIGFNAQSNGGVQSLETLRLMKFTYFFFPALGAAVALLLIRRYTLTEARAYVVKDILTQRRVEAAAAEESGS